MKQLLLYLWQLPQNLLGLIIILVTAAIKVEPSIYVAMLMANYWSGVSLGKYIIFSKFNYTETAKKHGQGHQKQSLYLGPLYLLVIGLPSVCGNLLHRIIKFNYYKQPWEACADRLGGVKRNVGSL